MKKLNNLILFLLLFLLLSINSNSGNLNFEGLYKLTLEDIQKLTKIDVFRDDIAVDDINQIIKDLYQSPLIYDVSYVKENNDFLLSIIESDIINEIYINGNIKIKDDQIKLLLNSKLDGLFNKNVVLNDISTIEKFYKQQGFQTQVSASTEFSSIGRVNLIFTILETDTQRLSSLKFMGNNSFNDKFLYSLTNINVVSRLNIFKRGSNLDPSLFKFDKNKLIKFYKDKGFLDVKVSYSLSQLDSKNFELTFYIDEGTRYKIKDIIYNFDHDDTRIIRDFKRKLDKNIYYDFEILNKHLIDLQDIAFQLNKPFVEYYYDLKFIDQSINLTFNERNIDKKIVNKINIFGNNITKDNTIRSKLSIEPGDLYNKSKLNKTINDLSRLPYINEVKLKNLEYSDNKTDLIIEINENVKTGNFLFGGSFSGDTGLGFGINLKDQNLLGTGNQLNTNLNLNAEKALFTIKYTSTPLNNANLRNGYSIYNQENDLTDSFGYQTRSRGVGYDLQYRYNLKTFLSAGLEYQFIEGYNQSTNDNFVTDNIGKFNNLNLNFSINYNNTNNNIYPTNGFKNYLKITVSPNDISDTPYFKINYRNSIYYQLKNSKNFIFNANNIGITDSLDSSKLRTVNAFSLGGMNFNGFQFRGIGTTTNGVYLGGNKYFTSTIGYGSSFIFDEKDNVNVKLFYTAGSLWDSDYTDDDFEIRSSAGISFDIMTAVGPLSLSYAVPIEKNSGDKVRNFNFSLGTTF